MLSMLLASTTSTLNDSRDSGRTDCRSVGQMILPLNAMEHFLHSFFLSFWQTENCCSSLRPQWSHTGTLFVLTIVSLSCAVSLLPRLPSFSTSVLSSMITCLSSCLSSDSISSSLAITSSLDILVDRLLYRLV